MSSSHYCSHQDFLRNCSLHCASTTACTAGSGAGQGGVGRQLLQPKKRTVALLEILEKSPSPQLLKHIFLLKHSLKGSELHYNPGVGMISGMQEKMGTFYPGTATKAFVPWNHTWRCNSRGIQAPPKAQCCTRRGTSPSPSHLTPLLAPHLTQSSVHSQQLAVDPLWPDRIH